MTILLLVLAQDLRTVVIDALRDRMTEARAKAVADAVAAELGNGDLERLLTHPVTRRSFDRMLKEFGAGLPYQPVPEKSDISRLWNEKVFELSLAHLPLKQAAAKLAAPCNSDQPRALSRAIEKALAPSRDYLSDEALVVRLVKIGGFRDAETLYEALLRAGELTLIEYPHRLDTPAWPDVDIDAAVKHVQNYVAGGNLKTAVDRVHSIESFDALVRDLYLGMFPAPTMEPDPRQKELIDALTAMRNEMKAICDGSIVPDHAAMTGVPFNPGNYKTQQTMTGANRAAWMMDLEEVQWALDNMDAIIGGDATFGQAQGALRITWVRPGSILATRGFAANDVLMAVNGITVDSAEALRKLRDHPLFQNPSVISVKVNRAGQDVYLTYSIPRPPQR